MMNSPVILAFLQNQYFNQPERVAKLYAEHGTTPEGRAKLNAMLLFLKSLTGRRLKSAFGEELCNKIIWEEASKDVGSVASHCPDPDPQHIKQCIEHFSPDIVLAFGKVAQSGVSSACGDMIINFRYFEGPHPAARHATVISDLKAMADDVKSRIEAAKVLR